MSDTLPGPEPVAARSATDLGSLVLQGDLDAGLEGAMEICHMLQVVKAPRVWPGQHGGMLVLANATALTVF